MTTIPDVTGVILAGGASSRFGSNKALVTYHSIPIIQHVAEILANLFSQRLLITNSPETYAFLAWPMTKDIYKRCGPLGGIHAALHAITTPKAFIVGCDMPFLNPVLIAHLCTISGEADATIPWLDAGPEPLYGVYSRKCLNKIEQYLQSKELQISKIFSSLKVHKVAQDEILKLTGDLNTFLNINYQKDLHILLQQANEFSDD